jgi:IPT/TIG domain
MQRSVIKPLLMTACLMFSAMAIAQQSPRMVSAEPDTGKAGDVIAVTGENLEKSTAVKIYLTDGTHDYECEVTEQQATSVKIKIPAKAKPGKLSLMVLTGGQPSRLLEQPVKVTVE